MYQKEWTQFAGRHDYDEVSARKFAGYGMQTFSINIFKWGLSSSGKTLKKGACIVRVIASPKNSDAAFKKAANIVEQLDSGTWSGMKVVRII